MTDQPEPTGAGSGGTAPERTDAGTSAPGWFVPGIWGDVLARGIAERASMLIARIQDLRRAADSDASSDASTEDRARTLLALVEADERLEKMLLRLEPWRSDSETEGD